MARKPEYLHVYGNCKGEKKYFRNSKPKIVKSKFTKICSICKKKLPKEDFYATSSSCKPCHKEYSKAYLKKREKLKNERIYGRKIDTNNEVK